MDKGITIVIAEDDEGHATLIERNLRRAGIGNSIVRQKDGQATLDYLEQQSSLLDEGEELKLLLLLDIKMPKVDGIEVLRQVKSDPDYKKIPVIMITTTDDPREVEKCHELGCNNYITKPIDYDDFVKAIQQLGLFLMVVEVPAVKKRT